MKLSKILKTKDFIYLQQNIDYEKLDNLLARQNYVMADHLERFGRFLKKQFKIFGGL